MKTAADGRLTPAAPAPCPVSGCSLAACCGRSSGHNALTNGGAGPGGGRSARSDARNRQPRVCGRGRAVAALPRGLSPELSNHRTRSSARSWRMAGEPVGGGQRFHAGACVAPISSTATPSSHRAAIAAPGYGNHPGRRLRQTGPQPVRTRAPSGPGGIALDIGRIREDESRSGPACRASHPASSRARQRGTLGQIEAAALAAPRQCRRENGRYRAALPVRSASSVSSSAPEPVPQSSKCQPRRCAPSPPQQWSRCRHAGSARRARQRMAGHKTPARPGYTRPVPRAADVRAGVRTPAAPHRAHAQQQVGPGNPQRLRHQQFGIEPRGIGNFRAPCCGFPDCNRHFHADPRLCRT